MLNVKQVLPAAVDRVFARKTRRSYRRSNQLGGQSLADPAMFQFASRVAFHYDGVWRKARTAN
jgi:hypothetical protein